MNQSSETLSKVNAYPQLSQKAQQPLPFRACWIERPHAPWGANPELQQAWDPHLRDHSDQQPLPMETQPSNRRTIPPGDKARSPDAPHRSRSHPAPEARRRPGDPRQGEHDQPARRHLPARDRKVTLSHSGSCSDPRRRPKGDQEGQGAIRGLPYGSRSATCPVRAWRAWREASGITGGAAFRAVTRHGHLSTSRLSDRAVADMIKRRAQRAGVAGDFAGHSLRAGFATEAYAQGTPELAIMRHGRWRSTSVMRGYVEEGGVWNDNAAHRLGL